MNGVPAEIRAPAGSIGGVSSFQVQISSTRVYTPGEQADVLVAFNPAALRANLQHAKPGGMIIVDAREFTPRAMTKVGFTGNPLVDGTLAGYQLVELDLSGTAAAASAPFNLGRKEATRGKNMVALGLLSWLYSRPLEENVCWLGRKFASAPVVRDANIAALNAGQALGESSGLFPERFDVPSAQQCAGCYRQLSGNTALAYGFMTAAALANMDLFMSAYPITPASSVLHTLAAASSQGVTTVQTEDEIAAIGAAIGASYGGKLGITVTSGPGMALKTEMIGLAVMTELPLVIVDVQRSGPSTGMPTRTGQGDLGLALYGRPGEAPLPVLAAQSAVDCYDIAIEAARIAISRRTPVIVLTDGHLADSSEPWLIPDVTDLGPIDPKFATGPNSEDGKFRPYRRDDKLARDWAIPGTPGLEHRIGGLEKDAVTGAISYEPANHQLMVQTRQAKVDGIVADVPDLVVDDPTGLARVLVIGWGSTWGPIAEAVARVRATGRHVANVHVRHLNPLPANIGTILRSYDRVLVPELNNGQFTDLLRAKYLVPAECVSQVTGQPLNPSLVADTLTAAIDSFVGEEA